MSQVKPMPPRTWTAARAVGDAGLAGEELRGGRRAVGVAGAADRRRRPRPRRSAARASSTRTYMSASRCLIAWNDPIGTPNCSRSSA